VSAQVEMTRAQLAAWPQFAREVTYRPAAGGQATIAATLRSPTSEELLGGLPNEARILTMRSSDLDAADITPDNYDRVEDLDGRTYTIQAWRWVYVGSSRAWMSAEVTGG
jgi:hypothetical protein